MNYFGQMGNNMNKDPNKMEIINHLTNQNMMMQEQIERNKILIEKLRNEQQPSQNNGFINIKFCTNTGISIVIPTRKNIQMNALLRVYMLTLGIESNVFKEDLMFIYDAKKLDQNDSREINHPDIKLRNNSTITVFDKEGKITI